MSWIFNIFRKSNTNNENISAENLSSDINIKENSKNSGKSLFGSDSFEQAAKSAKILEKSKFSKQAYDLSNQSKITDQIKYQEDMKAYELGLQNKILDQKIQLKEDMLRQLEEETRQDKGRLEYQDHLARQRKNDEINKQKQLQEEQLRKQEQSLTRQEESSRKNIQYENQLKHNYRLKEIEAEEMGKAKTEIENHAMRMENIRLSAEEHRETVLSSIKSIGNIIGTGMNDLFHDKSKIATLVAGITLTAGGIYGMKTTFRFIENRIGKPSLIRETSRLNIFDLTRHPIKTIKSKFNKNDDPLANIVLNPILEDKMRRLAIATRHTRANKGFYRNVLLYGPPGTGKTFYAKSLAKASNMDYAIMSGGDVTPLGEKAVSEMHKIFDWSNTSRKGVILFIDEADAFLYKRNQVRISEHLRSTLNAFLQRTGEQSRNIMVVFASNAPEQFDNAINSRIDEVVEFPLPNLSERIRLFRQYFQQFILVPASTKTHRIKLQSEDNEGNKIDWEKKMEQLAAETEGLSGRDISKIGVDWQASAYSSDDGILSLEIVDRVVNQAKLGHKQKEEWKYYKIPVLLTGAGQSIPTSESDFITDKVHPSTTNQIRR